MQEDGQRGFSVGELAMHLAREELSEEREQHTEAETTLVCPRNSGGTIVTGADQGQPVRKIGRGQLGASHGGSCSKGQELGFHSECHGFLEQVSDTSIEKGCPMETRNWK